MKPVHFESKFVFNWSLFEKTGEMKLLWGRGPRNDHQLIKGEDENGRKMELVGCKIYSWDPVEWTPYWGWSS